MNNRANAIQNGSNLPLAYLLGVLAVIIFGATLPVTKLALADFSPWFLTFGRAMIAVIAAMVWLAFSRKSLRHHENRRLFTAGLFVVFGFPIFMTLALETVSATHGGVILGILPLATAIVASLIAGEKHSALFWTLSATGAAILIAYTFQKGQNGDQAGLSLGNFWLVVSGICAAAGYVISGQLSKTIPGYEVICRALILTSPLTLIGLSIFWQNPFQGPAIISQLSLLYLGLFSMFIGFFAWNAALAMGGIGRIGQIQLLQTFVTLIVSVILLNETVDDLTLAAAMAITVIIAMTRKN